MTSSSWLEPKTESDREEMEKQFNGLMAKIAADQKMNTEDNQTRLNIEGMRNKRELFKTLLGTTESRMAAKQSRTAAIEDRDHNTKIRQEEGAAARKERIFNVLAGKSAASKGQGARAA